MTRPLRPLGVLVLLWLASTAAMFQGCDGLFKPRTPQPPTVQGVTVDYSSMDATLETMNQALQAKLTGNARSAWTGALATANDGQAFQAAYDQNVLDIYTSLNSSKVIPNPWTETYEENFYSYFVIHASPQAQSYAVVWDPDPQHPNEEDLGPGTGYSDRKIIHRHYTVVANFDNGNIETVGIGYADLTFLHSNAGNRWVIAVWADRYDPDVVGGFNPADKNEACFTQRRLDSL